MSVIGEGFSKVDLLRPADEGLLFRPVTYRSRLGTRNYLRAKRVLDVLLSAVGLIALLPVFVAIAIVILITDGSPVLFKHRRVGRFGRPIYVYKFRSMRRDAEKILRSDPDLLAKFKQNYKLDDDPRITPFGRFLRNTSLDELPQLLNVFLGQMSLVGPRPIVQDELERYGDHQDVYLSLIPGCTGLWQCSGRSDTSYDERVDFDLRYAQTASVRQDLRIIVRTIPAMLARRGAR